MLELAVWNDLKHATKFSHRVNKSVQNKTILGKITANLVGYQTIVVVESTRQKIPEPRG